MTKIYFEAFAFDEGNSVICQYYLLPLIETDGKLLILWRKKLTKSCECLLLLSVNIEIFPPLGNVKSVNCLRKLLALP